MMDDETLDAAVRERVLKMLEESTTEDDLVLARIITNLALDACNGDRHECRILLDDLTRKFPAVSRLFAKVGGQIHQSKKATKQ